MRAIDAVDNARAVHVALDEVAVDGIAGPQRVLQVHRVAGLKPAQVRPIPGLGDGVEAADGTASFSQREAHAVDRYAGTQLQPVGQLAQLGRHAALDRGDVDGTVSAYEDRLGVPASIVVAKDVADGIRQQRAKQQQQAQDLQALNLVATAGKTASEIDVGGGRNAVSAAMGTA